MKLLNWLNQPKSPYGLGLFRILFGVIILWDLNRFHNIKIVESFYVHDIIFPYEFLNLPLPEQGVMELIMATLAICAICITLGVLYRVALTVFALGFSYFFFLDQVLYNNHLYMLCLVSFMMIFIPADAAFSLNTKRKRSHVPQWSYRLLQFQVVVVYFFGAIVKMNPYWFDFHPVEEILNYSANRTGSEFLRAEWLKYLFGYGGFLFDLLIGPLLWFAKTRKVAIILAVLFNITNSYIFNDIFIFPFFMISALILFVDQDKLAAFLQKRKLLSSKVPKVAAKGVGKIGALVIVVYVLFQLCMPLRHYFIPGYTDWTGEAQRFSWRMKIQHREIEQVEFRVYDLDKKMIHEIDPKLHLFPDEITQMCHSPQMILQFANYLKDKVATKAGITNCMIKCKIKLSFNGRPSEYLFNPDDDLLEGAKKYDSYNDWLLPIPEAGPYESIATDTTWF